MISIMEVYGRYLSVKLASLLCTVTNSYFTRIPSIFPRFSLLSLLPFPSSTASRSSVHLYFEFQNYKIS